MTNTTLTGLKMWGFIALFTSFITSTYGFGIYLFPALAPEMIKDIKFSYTEMGITTGLVQASFLVFALISGLLTSWVGAFRIIMASVILCGLSLLGLIWADSFLIISFFLIVMGGCASAVWVPMVEVCQNYISPNHHGRALGLMSSGTSYGVFINGILIYYFLDDLGWRFLWGATFLIVAMVCFFAFFTLRQDKQASAIDSKPLIDEKFFDKIRTLPKGALSLLMLMMFLNGLACIPYQTYLSSLLVEDYGLAIGESASAWRLIGFAGMFGGFLMGWVADKITIRLSLLIVYLFLGVSTFILLYAEITQISLYIASILFGLSFYAIFGLVPAYISHMYKAGSASLVFAFGNIALGFGGIIGNSLGGWLKQEFGSFAGIYLIILVACFGSSLIALILPKPAQIRHI